MAARTGEPDMDRRIVRGVVAALLGGVAFYLVLTTLWGRPPEGGRNYVVQFLAWSFAWAPGLVALTWDRQLESTAALSREET